MQQSKNINNNDNNNNIRKAVSAIEEHAHTIFFSIRFSSWIILLIPFLQKIILWQCPLVNKSKYDWISWKGNSPLESHSSISFPHTIASYFVIIEYIYSPENSWYHQCKCSLCQWIFIWMLWNDINFFFLLLVLLIGYSVFTKVPRIFLYWSKFILLCNLCSIMHLVTNYSLELWLIQPILS